MLRNGFVAGCFCYIVVIVGYFCFSGMVVNVGKCRDSPIENPRFRGSIPRLATKKFKHLARFKRPGFLLSENHETPCHWAQKI
jgi:hypothetical protein